MFFNENWFILFPGSSGMRVLTRNDLLSIMERSNASTFNEKLEFMELELLHQYSEDDPNIADAKHKLSIIRHQFKQKWSAARSTNVRFLETNKEWLKGTILLPKSGLTPGRPQKSFSDLCERSKGESFEHLT
ncbi:uncharacterized protein LOC118750011 isoform X2 [Rhagoletis pomonella]|uniref:uncharacterized protein LOC118750011 isoform X2 n=1 Tax=Rhagoletis pomonella TaxID=28610 RepID=UPI00177A98B1|nr:uncharacterized protein LOC118750011 isoform X2 [Rhagoletis pomonella]